MRVLLVSTGSGSRGGGEFYLLILAAALRDLGHEVHLSIPSHSRMDELRKRAEEVATLHVVDGTNTYDRPFRQLGAIFDAGSVRLYRKLFERVDPDIIHINQQVLEDGLEIVRAARQSGLPFVLTTHVTHGASDLGARYGWLRDIVSKYVVARANCPIITVSSVSRQVLIKRLAGTQMSAESVKVVYNGVDTPRQISSAQRTALRNGWGVKDESPVMGVVGRIEAQKNPLFFARLVAALRTLHPEIKGVWIGDGQMREELMSAVGTLGIAENFYIDGWRDDVGDRLQALDVFVLPSKFEGLPFALQEAMHSGLPVCVAEVDGMGEVIEDGVSGYLCRPYDIGHWVERVQALLINTATRNLFGQRAREFAQAHFSMPAMGHATAEIYTQAIESFWTPA